jgi:NAD(P)-dependent dehydrogenase (short-subunit alcohol dehydrogenase family)
MKAFESTIKLNVVGTFSVCSKVAAKMMANEPADKDGERGVLINVASVAFQVV